MSTTALRKLHNFDDWIDFFRDWQSDLGVDGEYLRSFKFDTKFGPPECPTIEFGHYRGRNKWATILEVPDQRIRDALLNLIVVQGDTEFGSVAQQRELLKNPPSDYDMFSLQRVMAEEMRHGWQMCYLLCEYFGSEGRSEAAKLLQRRADEGKRLLGSFNEMVENWLDFFTYPQFIDRDGKFQLKMLSTSAFEPLARSMGPMLREESFHLGTGNNGLLRIVKSNMIPPEVMQRYFNKWVPTAFDLFGTDGSSSAHWSYVWGLKGRYDERDNEHEADKGALNEHSRSLYRDEVVKLVERLNHYIEDRDRWLYVPHLAFNRRIGIYGRKTYDVQGNLLSPENYKEYIASVTPTAADRALIGEITKHDGWIEARHLSELSGPGAE